MLTLQLCAMIGCVAPEQYYTGGLQEAAGEWIDWSALYKELLVQGRIWDFKDLYIAAEAAFYQLVDELFFGTGDIKRSLLDNWVLDETDESTNLAQLELLLGPASPQPFYMDEAKSRAEATTAHSPTAMKSRPYIWWILENAGEALHSKNEGENDPWLAYTTHLQDFSGMMVWHSRGCWSHPGYYVPRKSENPGWVAAEVSSGVIEACQLALNLAKELKDYKSQVTCYKLLISLSPDPTQLLQELAHFQKSTQGDRQWHLETLLFSYLVCKDRQAKESLLEELEQTDDWGDSTMLRDVQTFWARDFIERATKRSLEGPESTARLRNPASFYMDKGLPWEAEQFTWQNASLGGLPPRSEPYLRQGPPVPPPRRSSKVQREPNIRSLPYVRPYDPYRKHSPWPEPSPPLPRYLRCDRYLDRRRQRAGTELQEKRRAMALGKEMELSQERKQWQVDTKRQYRHEDLETYLLARETAERERRGRVEELEQMERERERTIASVQKQEEGRQAKEEERQRRILAKETSSESEKERRRERNNDERRSESKRDEADHHNGDDIGNPQKNSCTALVRYGGLQSAASPDVQKARCPLLRSPTSPALSLNGAQVNTGRDTTRLLVR